ncbi:SPT3 Dosage dependent suppressor of Ty-induced promoter mutations-like protein [Cryptotrichosporon argae]
MMASAVAPLGGASPDALRAGGDSPRRDGRASSSSPPAPLMANTYQSFVPQAPAHAPSRSPTTGIKPLFTTEAKPLVAQAVTQQPSAGPSRPGTLPQSSHGGSRTDPPRRKYEVDGLPLGQAGVDEIAASYPARNRLLLQGDPQVIHKQRVETAIRVIIDVLRLIPPSPSLTVHPSIAPLLPRDPSGAGTILAYLERLAHFRGLRLQAGTTTKASSKKQLQAGATPPDQLAYLETAVYMSGDGGRRVYVCKRCRAREERRKDAKEAMKKKQAANGNSTVNGANGNGFGKGHSGSEYEGSAKAPSPGPYPSVHPPSADYITGENPDQYDPHREGQRVEEPPWDPTVPDWRHDIVLFNTAPEVAIKDGSCFWLPFRVVCYGKCHGEKTGFRIKFTLRTHDGRVVATETTHPIKITDDHKTESKGGKPKTVAVQRARKARQSTISSSRQSPAPSESELSVASDIGAIISKRDVRPGKPYQRPPSQSPAQLTTNLPLELGFDRAYARPHAAAATADISNWVPSANAQTTVSPGVLRQPAFSPTFNTNFQSLGLNLSPVPAQQPLPPSLGLVQPSTQNLFPDLMSPPVGLDLASLGLDLQSPTAPVLFNNERDDVDMSTMASDLDNLYFAGSSHTSVSSSCQDDSFSQFNGSLYSNSGLPPDSVLDDMIDYSGGESQGMLSPVQHMSTLSPLQSQPIHIPDLFPLPEPQVVPQQPIPPTMSQEAFDAQALLVQYLQQQQAQAAPVISHVIPAEGHMSGGTSVAVAGRLFTPETVIVFGGRPAITSFVSDGFVTCILPASPQPGDVEVTVQGVIRDQATPPMLFKYTGMDKEMMRLMLEVRSQHSSSDAAFRLVEHITKSHNNSDRSDRSSQSPAGGNGSSPMDADVPESPSPASSQASTVSSAEDDLQTMLITFLASLDENAPGSLRRSGAINTRNAAKQTVLHVATIMGFHRLVRRLVVVGAHLNTQDANGYTPLAFAALTGQANCVRVLLEAGAAYDVPTAFGEMPLDLAKVGEHVRVEALLLSAVWSTKSGSPARAPSTSSARSFETTSAIDEDNPSSGSDSDARSDADSVDNVSLALSARTRRPARKLSKGKGKGRRGAPSTSAPRAPSRSRHARRRSASPAPSHGDATPQPTPALGARAGAASGTPGADDPPPYEPPTPGWMARTLSNVAQMGAMQPIPDLWARMPLPSSLSFGSDKQSEADGPAAGPSGRADGATKKSASSTKSGSPAPAAAAAQAQTHDAPAWVTFRVPSWDQLIHRDEMVLYTQAVAASVLNAVVSTTTAVPAPPEPARRRDRERERERDRDRERERERRRDRARSRSRGLKSSEGDAESSERERHRRRDRADRDVAFVGGKQVQVKQDRMLYLFWLPVLCFVGFWLCFFAFPILAGFGILYGRQVVRGAMRAAKGRLWA